MSKTTQQGNRGPEQTAPVKRVDYLEPIHFDPRRTDGALAVKDPATGFLKVTARLTRVGVFKYRDRDGNEWGELRTADEVFDADSMASFEMSPVTDDHPPEFVNADNVRQYQRGHSGNDVRRDGDYMVATVMITDAETIAKVEAGKCEVSNGYTTQAVPERGTHDGQEFAFRQTRIRGNHIAIVDRGRAGPECRILLDSGDAVMAKPHEDTMETKQLTIAGIDYDVPVQVADAIEAERKAAAEANQNTDGTGAAFPPDDDEEDEEMEDKKDSAQPDVAALQARIDMLEADAKKRSDEETARIDARAKLLANAARIVPEFVTDGVSNNDIRKAIVLAVNPSMQAKVDAHGDSEGYLLACYDQALELHADREKYNNQGARIAQRIIDAGGEAAKTDGFEEMFSDVYDRYDMSKHAERAAKWEQN